MEDKKVSVRSVREMIWIRFKRNRLAFISFFILLFIYLITVIGCEFFSPYFMDKTIRGKENHPPTTINFFDKEGKFHTRPFVYNYKKVTDIETYKIYFERDESNIYPVYFLIFKGKEYKPLGFLPLKTNLRLFGTEEGEVFLLGTDKWGRDMFSRILYGGRISLSISFLAPLISAIIGVPIGLYSGYFGGVFDDVIQRIIEALRSIPRLPLWMALSAALPAEWDAIMIYLGITVILSLIGWTGRARIIRGKVYSIREQEFVVAAESFGSSDAHIIFRHVLPACTSYIIVSITLGIPMSIIGETGLSFLGLGIRPPMTSWGALLSESQSAHHLLEHPWVIFPAVFLIFTILMINFVGDGIRDAVDPFSDV